MKRKGPPEAQGRKLVGALEIRVPLIPPSVNHYKQPYVRGGYIGWFVSDDSKAFKQAVALLAGNVTMAHKFFKVTISIGLGPKQKGDLDNFPKVILDALVEAKIIHSDAAITCLVLDKHRAEKPSTIISIEEGHKP